MNNDYKELAESDLVQIDKNVDELISKMTLDEKLARCLNLQEETECRGN